MNISDRGNGMLKVGIESSAYFQLEDYENGFAKIRQHGYNCVDLNIASPSLALYSLSEREYESYLTKIAKSAKLNDMEIFQAHGLWGGDMVVDTAEKRLRQIAFYKKQLRGLAFLNCKYLVIHPCMPFGWWGEAKDHDEILHIQMDELLAILPTAEEYGVTVCLENMPLGISSSMFIKELVQTANHKLVKACFDTGHAHVHKENIRESVLLLGEDLRVLHVHDNNGRDDAHILPFQGSLDWDGFLNALREIGYDGCMSLETKIGDKTPEPMKENMQLSLAGIGRYLATKL